MLVLLAPALIGMGITGAIMSVMTDPGDQVVGKVFDEEVTAKEFDEFKRLYVRTQRGLEDEQIWRFYAMVQAADRSGLRVSEDEVGKQIQTAIGFEIAQKRALDELKRQNISINTPEGQQKFRQIVLQYLLDPKNKPEFNEEEYREILEERRGMSVKDYELQQMREALIQRYLETLREMAVIDPDDIWDEFQKRNHMRVLELLTLPSERFEADDKAAEGKPGHVSEAQVLAYYKRRRADYDEPRRVDLEYLMLPFEDAEGEIKAPDEDELKRFNKEEGIAPVASFTEFEDEIRAKWFQAKSKDRVAEVMEAIDDEIQIAQDEGQKVDLTAISAKVIKKTGCEVLIRKRTGPITREDLDEKKGLELLNNHAVRSWLRVARVGKEVDRGGKKSWQDETSDVLGGPKGWFVLQAHTVKQAKSPKYEGKLKERVRLDYINGSKRELKNHYEQYKTSKYRKDPSWELEVVVADDSEFDGDHKKAKQVLAKALEVARKWDKKKFSSLRKFETDPDIDDAPKLRYEHFKSLDRAELEKHPILGEAAGLIPELRRKRLRGPIELKNKKGWAVFWVKKQLAMTTLPFEEVEGRVRENVRSARAFLRCEEAARALLKKLQGKKGSDLEEALEGVDFETLTTSPFARTALRIKEIPNAKRLRLISDAFSFDAEVDGPYFRVVPDSEAGNRVFLLRIKSKEDAPTSRFTERYPSLRADLLNRKKIQFAQEQVREMLLKAKGITPELLAYCRVVRDGPDGEHTITLRQIFVAPDREIIDGWLEREAKKIIRKAQKDLRKGAKWEEVVDKYSEDPVTRRRAGELAAAEENAFIRDFGRDFDSAVFRIANPKAPPTLVKSTQGFHLVRLLRYRGRQRVFQHLMVKTDPVTRKLPESVKDKAEEAAKDKVQKALDELDGASFGTVAQKYGDSVDPNGRGEEMKIGFVTHLEREAYKQYLEWELPESHESHEDDRWLPPTVEIEGEDGTEYHMFACERDPSDKKAAWDTTQKLRNRRVYHIQVENEEDAEDAREDMMDEIEDFLDKDQEVSWSRRIEFFQKAAHEHSKAPSAGKGGALGLIVMQDAVREYGPEFLKRVCYDGDSPVEPGYRTGVFRSEAGYHIVLIVDVEKADEDDEKRRAQIAEEVLAGTSWK